ncbi:hypothetical protein LZL87_009907 [Fusarium oxysporum]|nr:hypothetical protein LZL87_009907 [Fusarium oxysporum]
MGARLPHPRRQQVLSAPLAEIADTHAEMTDTDASCKQEAFNAARDASVSYINSPHDEVDAHYLSNHCQNGLMQDTNLTSRLAKACDFELAASEPTETAKARVISIGRMWEGKMRDLPDEMAAACDELHARSQVLDEWESVAKDEDW